MAKLMEVIGGIKTLITIGVMVFVAGGYIYGLEGDIEHNEKLLSETILKVESVETELDDLKGTISENHTNILLLGQQLGYMQDTLEDINTTLKEIQDGNR